MAENQKMQIENLNEKYLFHGTQVVEKIVNSIDITFNINFANDGMWGKGLYFATRAKYSDKGYAK